MIKKFLFICSLIGMTQSNATAQTNKAPLDMMEQMQQQMQKMFGGMMDSSSTHSFQMDTTLNKSFGMLFDGEKWRSLTESGDSTSTDFFAQFLQRFKGGSPNSGTEGFNFSEMFKGFEQMIPNMEAPDSMPRVSPENKKRKGEAETKEKKYSTEKI